MPTILFTQFSTVERDRANNIQFSSAHAERNGRLANLCFQIIKLNRDFLPRNFLFNIFNIYIHRALYKNAYRHIIHEGLTSKCIGDIFLSQFQWWWSFKQFKNSANEFFAIIFFFLSTRRQLNFECSVVTQHRSAMDSRALVPSCFCSPKKKSANNKQSNLSTEVIQFVRDFFPYYYNYRRYICIPSFSWISSATIACIFHFVEFSVSRDGRLQNDTKHKPHGHMAPTFRPSKLVLCALHVHVVHTELGRPPATNPPSPSQRFKAIKVYSTFARDDFVWTLSRCSVLFLFLSSCCCFRILSMWIFSLLCHSKTAATVDSNAIFFLARLLYLPVFLDSEIVKTF